jgi:two-component system, chemotaxis family, chemotaxis protein CheY
MPGASTIVLLIEPKDESRAVHADALRRAGFAVIAVPDCATGLYAVAEVTPQIVVASYNPRTRDECFALCERLKDDSRTKAIPVLLTAETITTDDLQRATDMKVLGVAAGPDDEVKITGAVRGVLAVAQTRVTMPRRERNAKRSA